jgi:DNA-directed RNA polymerase subunit RPC12/RpoP
MHEYTCPECDAVLKSASPAPVGKKIRCKKCGHAFVANEKPAEPEAPKKTVDLDEDDVNPYAVSSDPDAGKPKPKINFEHHDKDKRSARGPAMALLVFPTNLLIFQGGLMFIAGMLTTTYGFFPLIFTDVSPSEEEYREQSIYIFTGVILFFWGCLVCLGASRMQNLESYVWSWVGAVAGIPAGLFAAIMLRNPKVIAGFEEMEGSAIDQDEEGGDSDDDDDEDDDEED